jgi:protein-S-isoprenylcysteine O-methyltransferase Ste14
VIHVIAQLTSYVWLAFEGGLLTRDRIRDQGRSARDRGTLWLNFIILAVAVTAAGIITGALTNESGWPFGNLERATTGLGLASGNWAALAILLVRPAGVPIHRIFVEEAVLAEVMGRPYADYMTHTKRLVPGLC